jgi:hypothetical protein
MRQPALKANDRSSRHSHRQVPSPGGLVPTPPRTRSPNHHRLTIAREDRKQPVRSGRRRYPGAHRDASGRRFRSRCRTRRTIQTGARAKFGSARLGDTASTCNDPADAPLGSVVVAGTVLVGG